MSMEWPTIIEGGIPILGGLYATALGYGVIRLSGSLPSPFVQKALLRFRWVGPAVVCFGVFTAWQTLLWNQVALEGRYTIRPNISCLWARFLASIHQYVGCSLDGFASSLRFTW